MSLAWYQFSPKEDIIDIEIKMLDNSMPSMVRRLCRLRSAARHCPARTAALCCHGRAYLVGVSGQW